MVSFFGCVFKFMFYVTGERILRNSKKSSSKVKGVSELPARESPQGFSACSGTVAGRSVRYTHLNIPVFLNGRSQLTPSEVLVSHRIASVERAIHRIKNYRIRQNVIPLSYAH